MKKILLLLFIPFSLRAMQTLTPRTMIPQTDTKQTPTKKVNMCEWACNGKEILISNGELFTLYHIATQKSIPLSRLEHFIPLLNDAELRSFSSDYGAIATCIYKPHQHKLYEEKEPRVSNDVGIQAFTKRRTRHTKVSSDTTHEPWSAISLPAAKRSKRISKRRTKHTKVSSDTTHEPWLAISLPAAKGSKRISKGTSDFLIWSQTNNLLGRIYPQSVTTTPSLRHMLRTSKASLYSISGKLKAYRLKEINKKISEASWLSFNHTSEKLAAHETHHHEKTTIRIFDIATQKEYSSLDLPEYHPPYKRWTDMAQFSPSEDVLVTAQEYPFEKKPIIKFWDIRTPKSHS